MKETAKITAIILAAGRGTRAGGMLPKQWQDLLGKPLINWSVDQFLSHPMVSKVVVVYNVDDTDLLNQLPSNVLRVAGGCNRDDSVRCGLVSISADAPDFVLIHDAARPCLDQNLLSQCIATMLAHGAAAPALSVHDTLWRGTDEVLEIIDRTNVFRAQTPQCFSYSLIYSAHKCIQGGATDDVQIARAAGHTVAIVAGSEDNIKVTRPEDLVRAREILRGRMKLRVGNGFDVHRFGPGTALTLCGVHLPHSAGLIGHSDADVGMHAITDAIYGALAHGDIGKHFPPTDVKWRNAGSDIFLKHATNLATELGFRIANVDCTLICEFPKIGPHVIAMQKRLAEIMGVDANQVSIKGTTSERLGFTGREEGIAAIASAALFSI